MFQLRLEPADNERLANLCGPFDEHLRQLERSLAVEIHSRGNDFRVMGAPGPVAAAGRVLEALYAAAGRERLNPGKVHLYLQEADPHDGGQGEAGVVASPQPAPPGGREEVPAGAVPGPERRSSVSHGPGASGEPGPPPSPREAMEVRTRRGVVRTRGRNQARYVEAIRGHDINFGIGPAGTGKTYLAVACAVDALDQEMVRRLVLVRPAVEAGERLGFLPGDLTQKVDPYLRPLYDALYEMLGFERVARLLERNVIEVAPLAYMRGRTLNEAFIIMDEAQNTTIEQMKMFLTRIGFGSVAVITGDVTQIDLPRGQRSGLVHALEVLEAIDGISFTHFTSRDVVRHRLVGRILDAYAAHEARPAS